MPDSTDRPPASARASDVAKSREGSSTASDPTKQRFGPKNGVPPVGRWAQSVGAPRSPTRLEQDQPGDLSSQAQRSHTCPPSIANPKLCLIRTSHLGHSVLGLR